MKQLFEIVRRLLNHKVYVGRIFTYAFLMIICLGLFPLNQVFGQSSEPIIRVGISGDQVYVYHTLRVPIGHGFNIYRSESGNNFEKLNADPVQGAQNVAEFLGEIGEYADDLQQALEVDNPQALYLRLSSSRMAANLATFYYPDVARAMGHLYVDSTVSIGNEVTYRIELVDSQGNTTGKKLERKISLEETAAPQPQNLSAEHEKRQVTLTWEYPTSSLQDDDKIVRFNVYDRQGSRMKRINENPIVRINNFTEFEQIFTVPRTGVTLNLMVMPVDLTMQEGPASEVLEYTLTDIEPPTVITGLQAVPNDEGEVELTWPISTEADAKGYNIFRAERIKGNYEKVNDELIPLLETFYVDHPRALRTTYFYRVSAVDSSDNESKRSNAAKADLPDFVPPDPPTSFNAEPLEDGTVRLVWESSEREEDFKTYVLLRKQMGRFIGKADVQLNSEDLIGNSFIDKGEADLDLAEGGRYRYQIFAMDSARNFSDTLTSIVKIPDKTPPAPPTRLIIENDNGIRAILRWNASSSTDVGEYVVYRGTARDSLERYQTLSVNNRLMRDDSVMKGETYYYAIGAIDTLGNEGETTGKKSFLMKDFTPPRAVRNVRASSQIEEIRITWEPVGSKDLKGYKIYSSSSPTGVYKPVTDQLITETKYTTTNIESDAWIQVRALDTSGNESKPSDPAHIYIAENPEN